MSTYIKHIACDKCNSSDGLAVYEDEEGGYNGYCWVCETFFPEITEDFEVTDTTNVTTPRPTLHEMSWDITDRKLSKETCEKYGVTVGVDDDGVIVEHYYPVYLKGKRCGTKVRIVEGKKFRFIGESKGDIFWGQNVAELSSAKKLFITEGELDCLAVYQSLRNKAKESSKYANFEPAVVSLPNGITSASKALSKSNSFIDNFEEIILVFDSDDVGREMAEKVANIYPNKTFVVTLSEKDPVDMLVNNKEDELIKSCYVTKKKHRPETLVLLSDMREELLKKVTIDIEWPWPSLNEKFYGIRRGEVYVFGGGSGCGKTEIFKEVESKLLKDYGLPIGVFMLEEAPSHTGKTLAGKLANKRFHKDDGSWTEEELSIAVDNVTSYPIHLYKSEGVIDFDSIAKDIRYLALGEGVKDFFIDNLTVLTANAENERRELDRVMAGFSKLAVGLDITIYIISHLTRQQGCTPHEEGGRVHQRDFRGSGSIQFWANGMFGIERNTQAEDPEERNSAILRCLKDRFLGDANGLQIPLYYNPNTGRLGEVL